MIQLSQAVCDPVKPNYMIMSVEMCGSPCTLTGRGEKRFDISKPPLLDNDSDPQDYGIEDFCE